MRAKDVMSEGTLSVSADATVLEAAGLLVNCRVSAMPVVDEAGTMMGIVSEVDLMGDAEDYVARDGRPARKVADVMTRDVITASEDTPLAEIAALMKARNIKRIPILRNAAVVGIVSRVDILRGLISLSNEGARKAQPALGRDEDLRREIYAACQGRSWSQAKQMDVVVTDGVAHLWGVAPTDIVRQAYRAAAENVPGVKMVEVHMHIVPPPAIRVGL